MKCEIPIPPTANHLWGHRGHMKYRKKEYMEWLDAAGYMIQKAIKPISVPAFVELNVYGGKGFMRSRDLDNCMKAVMDCLQLSGIIANDNVQHVHGISVNYREAQGKKDVARCEVFVGEA